LQTPTAAGRDHKRAGSRRRDGRDRLIERGGVKGRLGTKTGLKLQPAFALWMMGFPEDWCDLADGEMPRSKRQATPSSRKSQRKLCAPYDTSINSRYDLVGFFRRLSLSEWVKRKQRVRQRRGR
jgi:hypothetical protein